MGPRESPPPGESKRNNHREKDRPDLPNTAISRQTLRATGQLLRYVLPYRRKLTAALVCLGAGSLLSLAVPYLAGNLVAGLLSGEHSGPHDWRQAVNLVGLGLLVVLALQAAVTFLRTLWFAEVGERGLADLRHDTYARLARLPMAFHGAHCVGELASQVSADLAGIRETLSTASPISCARAWCWSAA